MASKPDNITLLPYRERIALVRERLNHVRRPKIAPLPMPAKVQAAQKIVNEWQTKADAHEEAQREAHRLKLGAVQDALILGDMAKAVNLLHGLGA